MGVEGYMRERDVSEELGKAGQRDGGMRCKTGWSRSRGRGTERRREYRAGECRDWQEESTQLPPRFVQYQLTSSLVLQKVRGKCPSTGAPNLEIARESLHVFVCFHRGLQICKSVTLRKVENHSKSWFQMTLLPKLKLFSKLYFCIFKVVLFVKLLI